MAVAIADQVRSGESPSGALREEFRRDRVGVIDRLQPLTMSWGRQYLRAAAATLADAPYIADALPGSLVTEGYLERVAHLALERLLVHPASPPLLVSPLPESRAEGALAGKRVIAVVFDHPLAIGHELYPLWTDAFVHGQGSCPSLEVVGVHVSWLDEACRARRMIFFDPEADAFLEAPNARPVTCDAALLLCLSSQTHECLARRLTEVGLMHVNPYPRVSEVADDKWQCYCLWEQHAVPTPPTCLLERELSSAAARQTIDDFTRRPAAGAGHPGITGWIIQPRHGTESEGVDWISSGADQIPRLLEAWQALADKGDSVVRPRVGSAWLGAESHGAPLPFDLRLHVAWDGIRHVAESGYAVAAAGPDTPISSVSWGGQVVRLAQLHQRGIWNAGTSQRVAWSEAYLEAACAAAERAVRALGPLALAGVDVKYDPGDDADQLFPIILDVNPRPAGLIHSDLLSSASPDAGVTDGLWSHLCP